jgi:hypothetical protein
VSDGGTPTLSRADGFGCRNLNDAASETRHECRRGEPAAFRAGIEGRISVLMRGRGMKRCRAEGAERFTLFVGAAVLANNLMIVAALLTRRWPRPRKATR